MCSVNSHDESKSTKKLQSETKVVDLYNKPTIEELTECTQRMRIEDIAATK